MFRASRPRRALRVPAVHGAAFAIAMAGCLAAAPGPGAAQATEKQQPQGGQAAVRGKGGVAVDAAVAEDAAGVHAPLLDEINRLRAAGATCGGKPMPAAPPLRWNMLLMRVAEAHVRDMAPREGGSIGHRGSDGSTVGTRTQAAGYAWTTVGENVAAGRATASATLAQWMASAGHCANLMNPAFADVAVAGLHLPGTNYNHYWVMVLARP